MLHRLLLATRRSADLDTVTKALTTTSSAVRKGVCTALLLLACFASPLSRAAGSNALDETIALVDAGHFAAAESRIASTLQKDLTSPDREALEFERERMRRIRLDFTLDLNDVKTQLRKQIPDLSDEELRAWDAAGLIERKTIDGETRYFKRAPSNLFRLSAQAAARRTRNVPPVEGPMESANAHHREIVAAADATGKTSVAPRRVQVTYSIEVEPDAVPAGEIVRAWVPFPRALPGQQEDVRLIGSQPAKATIAPESTLQRTVYLEQAAIKGKPTKFSIDYELTTFAQRHHIDPDKVMPANLTTDLAPYVAERKPHIVFTDDLRKFSRDIVGDEKNPYRVAQKLFAAVDRIPWAGALEYSTISNISDYTLKRGHGDCGQQTLLLMTLLRLNGIPARWQSGWVFSDGDYDNMHDWGWLYFAPYGWVPMDVTTGRLKSGDPAIDALYLGGFDAYRIAYNDDFSQPFFPPKQHFRSETVDSQRGEVEWRGGNLYFDQWDYEFTARVAPH